MGRLLERQGVRIWEVNRTASESGPVLDFRTSSPEGMDFVTTALMIFIYCQNHNPDVHVGYVPKKYNFSDFSLYFSVYAR
jgi:hypothetical protein